MFTREAKAVHPSAEVLSCLRQGLRESSRLAEQLVDDAIVGNEARAMLGRLQAIRLELNSLTFADSDLRRATNDRFWNKSPDPDLIGAARQTGI